MMIGTLNWSLTATRPPSAGAYDPAAGPPCRGSRCPRSSPAAVDAAASWGRRSARHRSELRAVLRARASAPFCNTYATRPATKSAGRLPSSIERTADLGAGRRLVRLDRFGRKADYELSAALRGAGARARSPAQPGRRAQSHAAHRRPLHRAGAGRSAAGQGGSGARVGDPGPSARSGAADHRPGRPRHDQQRRGAGRAAAPARRRDRARRAHLGQGLRAAGRGDRPGLAR